MADEPEVDAHVLLRDGRRLAYCDWGDRDGRPILLCHGAPEFSGLRSRSRYDGRGRRPVDHTVDRPGYGRSDPRPGRRILDWPAEVEELTAALGVDEFDVAALSSGGPYALACAHRFPQRVQRVALISCAAPYDESGSEQTGEDFDPASPGGRRASRERGGQVRSVADCNRRRRSKRCCA